MGEISFRPLQTYKALKPFKLQKMKWACFRPLQTYKALKHKLNKLIFMYCFRPLQTYKALKLNSFLNFFT